IIGYLSVQSRESNQLSTFGFSHVRAELWLLPFVLNDLCQALLLRLYYSDFTPTTHTPTTHTYSNDTYSNDTYSNDTYILQRHILQRHIHTPTTHTPTTHTPTT